MKFLVKRPWGNYIVLSKSKDFLLKKIKQEKTKLAVQLISKNDFPVSRFFQKIAFPK